MPTIETLQAKRAALVASQEQLIGQINRVGGAISVIDELVSEQQAAWEEEAREAEPISLGGIDRSPNPSWNAPPTAAPAIAPEMIPVTKFAPCGQCVEPLGCEAGGCDVAVQYVAPAGDAA